MKLELHHKLAYVGTAGSGFTILRRPPHGVRAYGRHDALGAIAGAVLLALAHATLTPAIPGKPGWREPTVAEWPAQRLLYVADGHRLRVFRLGLGLAPLADVALPTGQILERLELDVETGSLSLVLGKERLVLDGRSLKPLP